MKRLMVAAVAALLAGQAGAFDNTQCLGFLVGLWQVDEERGPENRFTQSVQFNADGTVARWTTGKNADGSETERERVELQWSVAPGAAADQCMMKAFLVGPDGREQSEMVPITVVDENSIMIDRQSKKPFVRQP